MARVKKGVNAHKRHKKILKLAKGFYGAKSKTFKAANPAVMRSLRSAYIGRKLKKRQYRQMWIARINAAARMNDISYSRLMDGLKKANIDINRKMLSEMAIYDAAGFAKLVESAKAALKLDRAITIIIKTVFQMENSLFLCPVSELNKGRRIDFPAIGGIMYVLEYIRRLRHERKDQSPFKRIHCYSQRQLYER